MEPDENDNTRDLVKQAKVIGTTGALFQYQAAADLYSNYVWTMIGWIYRYRVINQSWGISYIIVERGWANLLVQPTVWFYDAHATRRITLRDYGLQHQNLPGVPNPLILPHTGNIPPPNPHGVPVALNAGVYVAHAIPWHHRVELTKNDRANPWIHYHQHARRSKRGSDPPRLLPFDKGAHYSFGMLTWHSQVSKSRHISRQTRENAGDWEKGKSDGKDENDEGDDDEEGEEEDEDDEDEEDEEDEDEEDDEVDDSEDGEDDEHGEDEDVDVDEDEEDGEEEEV